MSEPVRRRFVADTQALFWLLTDSPRLSAAANAAFQLVEVGAAELWLPTIVLAEFVALARKLRLQMSLDRVLAADQTGLRGAHRRSHRAVVREFERLDRPAEMHDRLIVATARVLRPSLITSDSKIRASGRIATIW